MPPKKKIVKTVRKIKPSTPSTLVSTPASAEPKPSTTQLEHSLGTESAISNNPTIKNDLPPEPNSVIEAAPKPSPKQETTEEPVMTVPEVSKSASGEAPEDTGVKLEEKTVVEPAAKSGTKTVIRVKKVVKKIVKRLVPKGSIAAKKVDSESLLEGNLSREYIEKDVNPNSSLCSIIQHDATDKTLDSNVNQQPEPENTVGESEMEDVENLESGKSEDNAETKDECPKTEAKEEILEGRQEGSQLEAAAVKEPEVAGFSERMKRRKTEIFIGGLDKDAKEEDIRSVFGKVGEISEVRLMMDGKTGKNKGYAFLRYVEPSQAKRAVAEFAKVEICGKVSGAAAVQGNDTIFLGNIDKKWKKEDVIKLLSELEIENIETITVMMDPNNKDSNRGFAFLELETNKDAQRAYKKLQKKDVFGKGRNIKVAWADSFNVPDEEEMQKVKSVYAEGIPDSWDEVRLKECFKKFGEIERVVLGRNIKSAKRKDIAFINYKTRDAALSCIASFNSEELTDNGSQVNLKVALAKRVQKINQNKSGQKSTVSHHLNEKYKPVQRLSSQDYSPGLIGTKRALSTLGDDMLYSDLRGQPRTRLDNSIGVSGSSYRVAPHGMVGSSLSYYPHQPLPTGYSTASSLYQSGSYADTYQTRRGLPPYTSSIYHKYQM